MQNYEGFCKIEGMVKMEYTDCRGRKEVMVYGQIQVLWKGEDSQQDTYCAIG